MMQFTVMRGLPIIWAIGAPEDVDIVACPSPYNSDGQEWWVSYVVVPYGSIPATVIGENWNSIVELDRIGQAK